MHKKTPSYTYDRSKIVGLDNSVINTNYTYTIKTGQSNELTVFDEPKAQILNLDSQPFLMREFGAHVVRKALSSNPVYKFNKLIKQFPNLKSIDEFIESTHYLGNIKITIKGNRDVLATLPQIEKLRAAKKTLNIIAGYLDANRTDYKGSIEFIPKTINHIYEKDKILNIVNEGNTQQEFGIGQDETNNPELYLDLSNQDWFAFNNNYGTSEEKYLVRFIDSMMNELQKKYDDVFMLRNEKHFKLYSFKDGKPLEPDFVLFLTRKEENNELHYQVFIEPKGSHLVATDKWKERFLLDLKTKHKIDQLWENKHYIVWGLPFYTHNSGDDNFSNEFEKLL